MTLEPDETFSTAQQWIAAALGMPMAHRRSAADIVIQAEELRAGLDRLRATSVYVYIQGTSVKPRVARAAARPEARFEPLPVAG